MQLSCNLVCCNLLFLLVDDVLKEEMADRSCGVLITVLLLKNL